MPINDKFRYCRQITSLVRKGSVDFAMEDRIPVSGGRAFVSSVVYDPDSCGVDYTLSDREGNTLVSAFGPRDISTLSAPALVSLSSLVRDYVMKDSQRQAAVENVRQSVASKVGIIM